MAMSVKLRRAISAPSTGMMMSATSDETILPNAVPMMTATARSTTLPFTAKSRNSFRIDMAPPLLPLFDGVVPDFEDLQALLPGRRTQRDAITFPGLEEGFCDGGNPGNAAGRRVDLVHAHDRDAALGPGVRGDANGRAEEQMDGEPPGAGDSLGGLEGLDVVADPPVDLAQAPLAVDVVGVLGAIAERGGPGDGLH